MPEQFKLGHYRLSALLGTHAEIWYELQTDYDLGQASQKKRPKIEPFNRAAWQSAAHNRIGVALTPIR
jgi:plasmid maintenance system antidote protein VapI